MAIVGKQIELQTLNAKHFKDNVRKGKYAFYDGYTQPSLSAPNGYGDPTGVTGNTNRALFRGGLSALYHVKGTQTLLGPLLDTADGLDISQDQTDNDGVEYVFGSDSDFGPFTFKTGTDEPFFIRGKFKIADVSGTDDFWLGFRERETLQANFDDYTDAAGLNVILGDIYRETILNNAATVSTDTTLNWADGETHTLEVRVVGRNAYFFVDGVRPNITGAQYTFASGLFLVPSVFFLQATTSPGKVFLKELEVGHLSSIGVVANG